MNIPNAQEPGQSNNVFVVDDDASFLKSISRLLDASGYSVQSFSSAREFLFSLKPDASGCVVVDLQMPDLSGFDLQEALAKTSNPLPLVFITGQGDIPATVRAMRGGAEDFLTKLAPKEHLLAAVQRALQREARERRLRRRSQELRVLFSRLSKREKEIMGKVILGKMNKHIAAEVGISERTVKLHRTGITRKLGIQSVAELTRLAAEAGMFSSTDSSAGS